MAIKQIFSVGDGNKIFSQSEIEYKYYGGFAISQRRKCVQSLHEAIMDHYPECGVLEISSKSLQPEGVLLSAFNLKKSVGDKLIPVECIFQASKVFENGGPYYDIWEKTPREAKKDDRLRNSGQLTGFTYNQTDWPLEPKSFFYDWLYISALAENTELADQLMKYKIFTDIEFNHKKSINCQARSAAIYVTLRSNNLIDAVLNDIEMFRDMYNVNSSEKWA